MYYSVRSLTSMIPFPIFSGQRGTVFSIHPVEFIKNISLFSKERERADYQWKKCEKNVGFLPKFLIWWVLVGAGSGLIGWIFSLNIGISSGFFWLDFSFSMYLYRKGSVLIMSGMKLNSISSWRSRNYRIIYHVFRRFVLFGAGKNERKIRILFLCEQWTWNVVFYAFSIFQYI